MRDKISLFGDFYDVCKELGSDKLIIACVKYMFEDIEPTELSNLEMKIFEMNRVRFDNLKQKSDAGSKGGSKSHGGGRPKQAEEQQKNNEKTSEKQTKKQAENKQVKVEDKVYVEDINNNLSTIVDKEQSSFGNEEINNCLDLIKSFNNGIIDGTIKEQRQYGKLLIDKLEKLESVKNGNYKRNQVLETILQIISQNTYHSQKIAGPKRIYYELGGLMQICKSEFTKKKKAEIPFIPGIGT